MEGNYEFKSGTMAAQVKFYNDGSNYRLTAKKKIAVWVEETIVAEKLTAGNINYIFCSPEKHIQINRDYLGHDYYTDVITFDYTENGVVSGDIYIDPETVKSNAAQYSATFRQEMLRVIIHGILHLCGYKDHTDAEQIQMRQKEDEYLNILALKHQSQ